MTVHSCLYLQSQEIQCLHTETHAMHIKVKTKNLQLTTYLRILRMGYILNLCMCTCVLTYLHVSSADQERQLVDVSSFFPPQWAMD